MSSGKERILVVDDEKGMRDSLYQWLTEDGYEVVTVANGEEAVEKVKKESWNVMLIDLKMPGMDGIETMRTIRKLGCNTPVIIITAYATVDTAVQAMKDGAHDYVVKPCNPQEISLLISQLIAYQRLVEENIYLRKELTKRYQFKDIIGKSNKMQTVFELVKTVADSKSTILIQGESGTGKEMIARAVHQSSPRCNEPFITLSCGSLAETLLESELFGHERGAFTDAKTLKKGRLELAEDGTLFLDEIGDISPKTQINLLRFLEEKEFTRVGGTELLRVDVRIIAATNKHLQDLITKGLFREDLYYRLNVINIALPPLRERKEDIPLLIAHFLEKYNIENKKSVERVSEKVLNILMGYNWPGNVRELENVIERAVVVSKGPLIQPDDLPVHIREKRGVSLPSIDMSLAQVEKSHILNVLFTNDWSVQKAAEVLKIDRATLYRKIEKYDLKKP